MTGVAAAPATAAAGAGEPERAALPPTAPTQPATAAPPPTPAPEATPARTDRATGEPHPPVAPTATPLALRGYVVAPGDTLSEIAERLGVSLAGLLAANPELADHPDSVLAGQALALPARAADGAAEAVAGGADGGGPALAAAVQPSTRSGREEPRLPPNLAPYQADFLRRAIGPARESRAATGVPASVTLAQAILESDWGRSRLATEGHNYFGIKATRKPGPAGVVWMRTYEAGIGYVNAPFRAYHDMAESFVDHGKLFFEVAVYASALAVRDSPRDFARAIHQAGYATAPDYSSALLRLMDRYALESYD